MDLQRLLPIRAVSICDFEPLHDRLPLVSLPVCGHISGAAYFYRVKEATDPITGKKVFFLSKKLSLMVQHDQRRTR